MKIDRNNYEQYALDYLEGNLAGDARKAFESFLKTHPEEAAGVYSLSDGMPRLEPEPWVIYPDKQALKRAVPMYEAAPRRTRRWVYYASAAAALAVVSVLGIGLFRTQPVENPTAPSVAQVLAPAPTPTAEPAPIPAVESAPAPVQHEAFVAQPSSSKLADASAISRPATTVGASNRQPVTTEITPAQSTPATDPLPIDEIESVTSSTSMSDPATLIVTLPEGPTVRELITERAPESESQIDPITGLMPHQSLLAMSAEADASGGSATGERFRQSRGGRFLRGLVQPLVEPLDGLSPVTVYRNNDERIVEVASYVISRKRVNE